MCKQQQPALLDVVQRRGKALRPPITSAAVATVGQSHEQQQLRPPVPHVSPRAVEPQQQLPNLVVQQGLRHLTPML